MQGFFEFNNNIIEEINDFSNSSFDLLTISGPKGSSKSETIEKAIKNFKEDKLVFMHYCFKNTVIDDFLLNFYDALRNFSLAQKISVKKLATDNFKEKVSHYFKTIEQNCIVVVENFENCDENIEIIDFLSHLATYQNVKIIIVTRNADKNLFRFKKIKIKDINLNAISKDEFKSKLIVLTQPIDKETQEKMYEITQGLELYLKMTTKYSTIAGVDVTELINEFENKSNVLKISYEEFIVSKLISLTPANYYTFFKILCCFSIPIGKNLIEKYKLNCVKGSVEYLAKNYLISFFKDEIYVKDYFKSYVTNKFSIQEKINFYETLVKIYEEEITKSPKNRLIRLSRESLRKEIETIKKLIPTIKSNKKNNFAYINTGWEDEKIHQKIKLEEKLRKIKERKDYLTKNKEINKQNIDDAENSKETESLIKKLISSSIKYTEKYQYNEAISELTRTIELNNNNEYKIEILLLLAKNYEHLNDYNIAQKKYFEALKIAIDTNDSRKSEIEYLIAMTNKNLYKISEAKSQFLQLISNETNSALYRRKAHFELGEIYEANSEVNNAIKHYKECLVLSLGKDKELACKIYYRLGVLYDENQDFQNAIRYYEKNHQTSSSIKENKYYSASLNNLALIFIEQSQYTQASEYLKLALSFDMENNDIENVYFTQKELAKLYTKIDKKSALGYYKQALLSAQQLNDIFKIALVYFEVGELYYDEEEDRKALTNFLNAKHILQKSNDKENIQRINSRINDIKIRLDETSFRTIMEKYDNNTK